MANSKIKITYFNVSGRAEVSRLILVAAGKEFEDYRISGEKWRGEVKATAPFGICPVLEVDGKQFGQSRAIAAFLAREFDLYGQTSLQQLEIDQVAHLVEDFIVEFGSFYYEPDETKKAEIGKKLKEVSGPRFLGFFEKMLNYNDTGYTVGDRLSMADIVIFDMATGFLAPFVKDSMDKFPLVQSLVDKVGNIDRIKAYIETRKDLKPVE